MSTWSVMICHPAAFLDRNGRWVASFIQNGRWVAILDENGRWAAIFDKLSMELERNGLFCSNNAQSQMKWLFLESL